MTLLFGVMYKSAYPERLHLIAVANFFLWKAE